MIFSREGGLYFPQKAAASLQKSYYPKRHGFDFEISLSAASGRGLSYVLEHNFHFGEYESMTINGEPMRREGRCEKTQKLEIHDAYLKQKITISIDHRCDIYYFPLQTLSQSETGFELSTQGISFAMVVPFDGQLSLKGSLEVADV